jgi:hypothetical protein
MSEQMEKMFEKLISGLDLNPEKYLVEKEVTPDQDKIIKIATEIFQENIEGEITKYGGKLNEVEFKKIEAEITKRLENPIFKTFAKDLDKISKKWIELKKEELKSYIFVSASVKEMPFPTISFMTVPRITWEGGKVEKMQLNKNGIAYVGEIQAIVTRTVLYGKIAKKDPLFAPHIGQLDLADYKPDADDKKPKAENFRFILEIMSSMERKTTQNQVVRYDDQYERHGEPICDFLMKDEELKKALAKLTSGIDSKRQVSNAGIPAIVLPMISTSLVIAEDESSNSKKYEIAFESLIKLGAASYETPNVKKGAILAQAEAAAMTQNAMAHHPPGQGIQSMVPQGPPPGQPQLPVWTEEELEADAKARGVGPEANLPVWTEEELEADAKTRGIGPELNLPEWTEEELEKESARRQGAFNIPEWVEDNNMPVCPACGYVCRPGWPTCPVCGAEIKAAGDAGAAPAGDAKEEAAEGSEPETEDEPKVVSGPTEGELEENSEVSKDKDAESDDSEKKEESSEEDKESEEKK